MLWIMKNIKKFIFILFFSEERNEFIKKKKGATSAWIREESHKVSSSIQITG